MKYSIEHLLAGIKAHRVDTLEGLRGDIVAKVADIEKTGNQAKLTLGHLKEAAREYLRQLEERRSFYKEGGAVVIPGSDKIMRNAPTQYELDRHAEQLVTMQKRMAGMELLAETNDTDLELFLQAVQAGGETHLTQNALKSAGFDVKVSQYLIAHNKERGTA